jgi:hypothetical protein
MRSTKKPLSPHLQPKSSGSVEDLWSKTAQLTGGDDAGAQRPQLELLLDHAVAGVTSAIFAASSRSARARS